MSPGEWSQTPEGYAHTSGAVLIRIYTGGTQQIGIYQARYQGRWLLRFMAKDTLLPPGITFDAAEQIIAELIEETSK